MTHAGFRRAHVVALAMAAAALFVPAAQAASAPEIFQKHNLIGIFAWNCGKPAAADNFYYVNRVIDANTVQRDIMDGPSSRRHVTIINSAADIQPNEIAVAGTLNGNTPVTAVWRIEGARMVPTEVTESGQKTISARIVLANRREMPWMNKCQQGRRCASIGSCLSQLLF